MGPLGRILIGTGARTATRRPLRFPVFATASATVSDCNLLRPSAKSFHTTTYHSRPPATANMPPFTNEKLLVHLPIDPPDGWMDRVKERFPGLEVRWVHANVLPSGLDNADILPQEVLDGLTMICVYPAPSHQNIPDVRYVQLASAGSNHWIGHPTYQNPEVHFCNGSGVHPPQIAEWVIGTWLKHVWSLDRYTRDLENESWNPELNYNSFGTDSVGRRMGILGYGAIGRNTARIAQAMGMEIYVHTHSPKPTPESRTDTGGYRVPGTGDPDGTIPSKWFSGDVDEFLQQDLDILVVAVPLLDSTRGLIGKKQFEILGKGRKKTFLSNIARGPIVDTAALIEALENKTISGAAVDVTDPEPLPKDHPMWKAPNLFMSPHISWQSQNVFKRIAEILYLNLEKLEKGEPMVNEVKRDL